MTGHLVGTGIIHAVISGLTSTDSGTITVTVSTATQVKVETAADGSGTVVGAQSVTAGNTLTVYAITRDAQGNFVANVTGTWSLTSISGGVANTDLSPTSGTSANFIGHLVGSATSIWFTVVLVVIQALLPLLPVRLLRYVLKPG